VDVVALEVDPDDERLHRLFDVRMIASTFASTMLRPR
jgi:hypothetical protein